MNAYVILSSDDPSRLAQSVSEHVAQGYLPLGGVSYVISPDPDSEWEIYHQAMILAKAMFGVPKAYHEGLAAAISELSSQVASLAKRVNP